MQNMTQMTHYHCILTTILFHCCLLGFKTKKALNSINARYIDRVFQFLFEGFPPTLPDQSFLWYPRNLSSMRFLGHPEVCNTIPEFAKYSWRSFAVPLGFWAVLQTCAQSSRPYFNLHGSYSKISGLCLKLFCLLRSLLLICAHRLLLMYHYLVFHLLNCWYQ